MKKINAANELFGSGVRTYSLTSKAKLTQGGIGAVFVVVEGLISIAHHRADLREFVVVAPVVSECIQENPHT